MKLWQDITHKDYENTKTLGNWLLRWWLVSHSRTSQPSPRVCSFPLSSAAKDTPQHSNIITPAENTERSPLSASVFSLCLSLLYFYITCCRLWQCGQNRTKYFFKDWVTPVMKKWDVISGQREDEAAGWALGSQGIPPVVRLCNCPDLSAFPKADNGK